MLWIINDIVLNSYFSKQNYSEATLVMLPDDYYCHYVSFKLSSVNHSVLYGR